jgi:long-chain acyl-CoA synthetase
MALVASENWFARTDLLTLWLRDAIHVEMKRLRPSYQAPAWASKVLFNRDDADIDSIELVDLASSIYLLCDAENSGALDEAKLGRSFEEWLAFLQVAFTRTSAMHFFSSGSSGERTLHAHSLESLIAEVTQIRERFAAIQQAQRIVLCVPSHHIYGFLFGILLPFALKCPVIRLDNPAAAELRTALKEGDICVAMPRQLDALTNPPPALGFLSAGAKLPDSTYAKFGASLLIDIYGSTETAGIGIRSQAGPFELLPRFQRMDTSSSILLDSYHDMQAVLAPDALNFIVSAAAVPPDRRDFNFEVGDRLDRVVQVSGVNVALAKVEAAIGAYASNVRAQVFLQGKAPNARIVARLSGVEAAGLSSLQQYLRGQLSAAEMPVAFELG